jgi:hypothetical protein
MSLPASGLESEILEQDRSNACKISNSLRLVARREIFEKHHR